MTMTTIGPSLTITGEITSQEDITLQGGINGKITMEGGALLVAPQGKVDADVIGSRMTIQGTATGTLTLDTRLELAPGSHVTGSLKAPSVVLQEGATFNGTLEMPRSGAAGKGVAGLKIAASSAKSDVRVSA